MVDNKGVQDLQDLAHILRIHSVKMTDASGSGHPTSCSSIAELISVLFFNILKYKISEPLHPSSDRFILSKGHAAPILYAAWAEAGLFSKNNLLNLRMLDSDLEGHPTPRLNFIDVATGSLGQGLGVAAGMAFDGLFVEKSNFKIFCLMGDGEIMEGSVWEAAAFAGFYKLHNLIAIIDVNSLGQSDFTSLKDDCSWYKKRFESFGFLTSIIDGHDINEIINAFTAAKSQHTAPYAIIAKTRKGAYFPEIDSKMNWHGKPLGKESKNVIDNILTLIKNKNISFNLPESQHPVEDLRPIVDFPHIKLSSPPTYNNRTEVATRLAAGNALVKVGQDYDRIVVCDADVKNSTYTDKFKVAFPHRFVDCFIAEQNLVSVATGLACRNRHIVFISTFAAFLTRAHDQLRMAAISESKIKIIGTHCGVSIGEDGGSQMGLEDIAMFRSLPNCVVLYPSDAVSAERAVELAANTPHMVYIRTSRPANKILYESTEEFEVGRSKILKSTASDELLVITGGVTTHEALEAANILEKENINVRVLDIFCIKPIDFDSIYRNALECKSRILTIEDHYLEGGIYEAVCSKIASFGSIQVDSIHVDKLPRSGKPRELLDMFFLSSEKILERIKYKLKLVK